MNHARTYPAREAAERSKRFLAGGLAATWHEPCGGFHLEPAEKATPAPLSASRSGGPTASVRQIVLERDGFACVCCGVSVIGRRYSLGHRLRASQGGKAVPSNLLTFLGWGGQGCHGRIDNRDNPVDEMHGYTVRSGQDPRLVGVMYREPDGSGITRWLEDDGGVLYEPPAGAVAVA